MEYKTDSEIRELQKKIWQIRRELLEKHPELDARKAEWMAKKMLFLA